MSDKLTSPKIAPPNIGYLAKRLQDISSARNITTPIDIRSDVSRLSLNSKNGHRGTVWALLDTSYSMEGAPLNQAKSGFNQFCIDTVALGFRIGVISFDSTTREISCATEDTRSLSSCINALVVSGGTIMAEPIRMAIQRLKDIPHERIIFLVTDGQPSDREETLSAARAAHKEGIDIMTLGTETADHDFLRLIASRSDLARIVHKDQLHTGIADASRLLLKSPSKANK